MSEKIKNIEFGFQLEDKMLIRRVLELSLAELRTIVLLNTRGKKYFHPRQLVYEHYEDDIAYKSTRDTFEELENKKS